MLVQIITLLYARYVPLTLTFHPFAILRFILKMKNALKDQEAALAFDRQEALKEQKAQMQSTLDQAQAEREDILQLYSKVQYCGVA